MQNRERKRQIDKESETGRQIETNTRTTLFIFLWPALCALLLCAFRLIRDNKNKLVLAVKLGYRVAKKLRKIYAGWKYEEKQNEMPF